MIDSITRITLNLQETNTMVSIRAKRGDTGRKLLIHLSDGSIPYHISDDCYATFTAKKPDGTKINNACTIENNVIEYEFTDQTCTAVGTMKAEIRLYGADDKMITSACFLINVYDTVFRDGDEVGSETEMNTLDDLILRANAFLNETGKLLRWQGNWDSEAEYEANDLVLHEDVLYVAEEAIAAGTAPGSEEVTAWVPIAGMGTGNGGEVVGIASVKQTTTTSASGGTNVVTVTLTDGTESEIKIRNGLPGASIQGPQGETGKPAVLTEYETVYQVSDSGEETPDGEWESVPPEVAAEQYLWTRTTIIFNSGDPVVIYGIAKSGKTGANGKSAYEYAVAGGYAGSEEDFAAKLAEEAVLCVPQALTEDQKAQARENIGAMSDGELGLPEVTEEDNGKLLLVENGEWKTVPSTRFVKNTISITAFKVTPGQAEMGSTVDSVALSWAVNMTPTALTLDGEALDTGLTSKDLSGLALTTGKTWTLKATDDQGETASKTAALSFLNGVYYGAAAAPDTLDSAFILTLTKVLTSSRTRAVTVTAGEEQHIWYAVPVRLGACTFTVGGFEGGFDLVDTIDFTNAQGYTESYYIYASAKTGLGETKVVVG